MPSRLLLAVMALLLAGHAARAQVAYPVGLIPTRTELGRVGLEKHWSGVVPLAVGPERLRMLSMADGLLFAATDESNLHAFDAETGRYLWGIDLGAGALDPQPVSVNSSFVFATNGQLLYCLDRGTGRQVWRKDLGGQASSPTAADEELVVVGLKSGKVEAYAVRDHTKDNPPGRSAGSFIRAWQSQGSVTSRPIPANKVIAFASADRKIYVSIIGTSVRSNSTLLYRFLTDGPITASMGTLGTRTLLAPSEDGNLYSIDLFDATLHWSFASGAPIKQEPLVAQGEIFVVNQEGALSRIHPEDGSPYWSANIGQARLLTVGQDRLYLMTGTGDLVVGDRQRGQVIASARETRDRAGLDFREYKITLTNRINDRIYVATPSGLLVCLREAGKLQPTLLRAPSQQPFGFIPDGEDITPPANPPAEGDIGTPAESEAMPPDGDIPAAFP